MAFKNALRKKFQGKNKPKGDIYDKDGYIVLPESNNGWGEDFYRKKLLKPNRKYKREEPKDDKDKIYEGFITLPKDPKTWNFNLNAPKKPWRGRENRRNERRWKPRMVR